MNSGFVTIEGKSRGYYLMVAILAALTIIGLVCFALAYVHGHQMFGSNNVVPWGMPIVLAIYLIGLSAGLTILAFLIYIMHQDQYRQVIKAAVFLAVVLIFGAMVAIAIDLGRPEKFWRLFMFFYLNNMSSMFAINAILYASYLLSAVIYLISLLGNMRRFSVIMGMVAFGWAMLTHAGTGAIFGFIAARETWFSALRPFEFILAALTSSLALLILVLVVVFKTTNRKVDWDLFESLAGLVKAFLVSLLILMVVGKLTDLYPANRDALMYMLAGPYSGLFWWFQIFLGAVVPLFILYYSKTKNSPSGIITASLLVVIGVFVKRYYLVIPGAAYPQHYYPGKIEGVYGAIGHFSLMPTELGLAIGIFALSGLIYVLGLKYLELLPAREDKEQAPALLEAEAPVEQ